MANALLQERTQAEEMFGVKKDKEEAKTFTPGVEAQRVSGHWWTEASATWSQAELFYADQPQAQLFHFRAKMPTRDQNFVRFGKNLESG